MSIIDQTLTYKPIEAKLAQTTNPKHRRMLENVLKHARGEVEEDLEAVMASLSANPTYRVRNGGPEMNPSGRKNVRRYYIEQIFGKGRHCLESNKERILVSDEAVITEGVLRSVMWGRDMKEMGMPIDDPEGYYLVRYHMLIVWPCDEDGYITGEESWSSLPKDYIVKITEADLPENFERYVAGRKKSEYANA